MEAEFEFESNETLVNETCLLSRPLLGVDPSDAMEVGERLLNQSYTEETLPEVVANLSGSSRALFEASFVQDITDIQQEQTHLYDSVALLLIVFLLFIIIITVWIFQSKRIRILHSTGLALLYGNNYRAPLYFMS